MASGVLSRARVVFLVCAVFVVAVAVTSVVVVAQSKAAAEGGRATTAQQDQQAQPYDVLIRNGHVIDGAGNPWVLADVAIRGDRIVFVGRAPADASAKRTID